MLDLVLLLLSFLHLGCDFDIYSFTGASNRLLRQGK